MKFKGRMELEHGLKPIAIVPLVNIFFLLVLFFMFSSSLVMQPGMQVRLPRMVTSDVAAADSIEIMITAENAVYVDGTAVTTQELKRLVKRAASGGRPVMLKADQHAPLGMVVELWDMCKNAGIPQVNLVTSPQ